MPTSHTYSPYFSSPSLHLLFLSVCLSRYEHVESLLVDMTTDDVAPPVLMTSLQAPSQSPKSSPLSISLPLSCSFALSQTYRSRIQIKDVKRRWAGVKGGERRWEKERSRTSRKRSWVSFTLVWPWTCVCVCVHMTCSFFFKVAPVVPQKIQPFQLPPSIQIKTDYTHSKLVHSSAL